MGAVGEQIVACFVEDGVGDDGFGDEPGLGGGEEEVAELDGVEDVGVEQHERAASCGRAHDGMLLGVEEAEFFGVLGEVVEDASAPFEVGA